MPATQADALDHNPNKLDLTLVAAYTREIKVPIARVWENVLDWEHLPWLHKSSFDYIELVEAGAWGWRTWSDAAHLDHIELSVANDSSYVARTYRSGAQISEIWTHLIDRQETTDIKVEFFIPDVAPADTAAVGSFMTQLYTQLWNEDEQMMLDRQARLLEVRDPATEALLGDVSQLKQRLTEGELITFQLGKREYQLRTHNDQLIAHASICPHLLGPLTESTVTDNSIRCPWHGYEFDLATGECRSPAEARCKLGVPPTLTLDKGQLIASIKR